MAGAEGFEPSTKVLETHVLPLHHAPLMATLTIIRAQSMFVKQFLPAGSARQIIHHDPGSNGSIQGLGASAHWKAQMMSRC